MSHMALVVGSLAVYVAITVFLTIRSLRKTTNLTSFALGNRDIGPVWVGLSLTAQLTSVATFVVNPGLVYTYGLSALLGFGLAAGLGINIGLVALSGPFRRVGDRVKALTIPQWIGARYQSTGLRILFALLSLSLMSFIVLIAVAIAYTLYALLQLQDASWLPWLVIAVLAYVYSYTLLGGASTSTYTNSLQAAVMLIVALILIGSGLHLVGKDGGLLARLATIDPNLAATANPASLYYRNWIEVFVCNFIVGLAIVCQPHILGKSLLLSDDRQIKPYLGTAITAGAVFLSVMFVGLYARVMLPGTVATDQVVPTYISQNFGSGMQVLISFGLLCAGISTLEGLLLALSAIFSSDLYLTLRTPRPDDNPDEVARRALRFGRVALILAGIVCVWLAIRQITNPVGGSVAIFAQLGVYLLFTATFLPIACGLFLPAVNRPQVTAGVIAALAGYLLPYGARLAGFDQGILHFANNPAVLATSGILLGTVVLAASHAAGVGGSHGADAAPPSAPAGGAA